MDFKIIARKGIYLKNGEESGIKTALGDKLKISEGVFHY